MIKKTTHYELSKPDYNETADIEVINSNMDIIDGALHELKSDLDGLGYGENGAYNLLDLSKLSNSGFDIEEGNITNKITDTRTIFNFYVHLLDKDEKIIN